MAQDKLLKELAERLSLQGSGNNIHGDYGGYWFTLYIDQSNMLNLITSVDFDGKGRESDLKDHLESIRKPYRLTYRLDGGHAMSMVLPRSMSVKATVEKAMEVLESVTSEFKALGLANSCYNCGANGRYHSYSIGGISTEICGSCVTGIEEEYRNEKETLMVSGNYFTGAIGAIIGALLGSVVWLVISYFGFIAALAGFAMAYMSYFGYKILKGKVGPGMPVIIAISVIIAIIFANVVEVAMSLVYSDFGLTFVDALVIAPRALFDNEMFYVVEVWKNIGLGLLFGVMGSYRVIRNSMDEAKFKRYEIERTKL
ncbi:hypothetical protein [Youngiibacter multivorans]|uniref:Uncharacterized protein n=1 Tax=Youngiibacter multivorans TaxID=937251 RepID=A0ABS4G3B8_9CLOT|nr:hypothetical protein [Youngiibacter multivorans]MBP1919043.1 hypothetical protein [Youngiibacter multivorans]